MNARIALLGLISAVTLAGPSPRVAAFQREPESIPAVHFELPKAVEMQERAGLTVQGTFVGRASTPTWIAQPSGEWIQVILRDSEGKLLMDRRLWPYAPGRQPFVTPTVMYARLGFPFEALPRCEPLRPGRYNMEVRYESPGKDQAIPVSDRASIALTVRSGGAVPLHHMSLEVPDRVVHDDFRIPQFGLNVRAVNDGCETQNVVPFAPESVTVQARTEDGRSVDCSPPVSRPAAPRVAVPPMQSWGTFVPFSGRCDIPLPNGAGQRTGYRVHVSYRGPGWTDAPLKLDRTVELELANLPHSSPPVRP
jgi:hypothetical protein